MKDDDYEDEDEEEDDGTTWGDKMKYKVLLGIMLSILLIGMTSASFGCFKPNENINLVVNSNSSSVNITEIVTPTPNSEIVIRDVQMSKVGNSFNYTYNDSKLGEYKYGFCYIEGDCFSNTFEITPSGKCGNASNIVFIIFLIILIYAISIIGYFKQDEIITLLGGMAMIFLGVYLINNGIIIYKDDLTKYFAYITSFIGAFFSIIASYRLIEENM